jgi:ribosomal protein S18 acetylase RimI-like enzyme
LRRKIFFKHGKNTFVYILIMDRNEARSESPTIIRRATAADIPTIYKVMKGSFAEYVSVLDPPSGVERETEKDVAESLDLGGMLLAWRGETAVGTVRFQFRERLMYVGRLGVLPDHRGLGIGSKLMEAVEQIARQGGVGTIEIIVRQSLESNLILYRKLGYSREKWTEHPKAGEVVYMYKDLGAETEGNRESGEP